VDITLDLFVEDFAYALNAVDRLKPIACNARTGAPYQPGIGPHTESATIGLVLDELRTRWPEKYDATSREVSYPESSRQKCDLCIGSVPKWSWCIEIKMLRIMGDNGKPNDNMLMHILSPYEAHRSAVTDCEKLARSQFQGRKGIVLFAYEYPTYPVEPAARSFELLSADRVSLGIRAAASFKGLLHPVHREGWVLGWEVMPKTESAIV
jgi:hypothetical protein